MQSNPFDEELTFKDCVKFLLRNKKIIFIFTFIGLIFSTYYASTSKNKWEGEMEIVLSGSAPINNNSGFSFLNNSKTNNKLTTQLQILKSPSVLKPVYDFLNKEKLLINSNYKKPTFKGWRDSNLDIKLVPSTSVLKIKYLDTNKNLILPVLTKISKEYKRYPLKSNLNTREKQLKSLGKIIDKAKQKSDSSFSKAQEYGNKHNIYSVISNNSSSKQKDFLNLKTNIELDQASAKNRITEIENNLKIIKSLDTDKEGAQLIITLVRNKAIDELNTNLITNNKTLIEKKLYLTPNDKEIQNLQKLINALKINIKKTSIEILEGEKKQQLDQLDKAISKKNEVNKFKILYKNAMKDEELLSNLEKEFFSLELNKLSVSDPWEIITNPTLYDEPISNSLKIFIKNLGIYFLIGLFSAISFELYKGKIYDNRTLLLILKNNLKVKIKKDSNQSWESELDFLKYSNPEIEFMNFIILDEEIEDYNKFKKIIEKYFNKKDIKVSNNLDSIYTFPNAFIFISEGITNIKNLKDLVYKLNINNKLEASFILLKR